jgi:hypothetical protein
MEFTPIARKPAHTSVNATLTAFLALNVAFTDDGSGTYWFQIWNSETWPAGHPVLAVMLTRK